MNEPDSAAPAINLDPPTTLAPPTTPAPVSRRGFAMGLVAVSSVVISFGGLVIRAMEDADALQINFYRSLALVTAIMTILIFQHRGNTIAHVRKIGRAGLLGGFLLGAAGICFLQSLTHTTVANTLFTLSAIPFITAALAWLVLGERLRRATLVTMVGAAAGIFVMMAEGVGAGSAYGNAMALVTACGFSGFAVIVRRYRGIDMLPTLLVSGAFIAAVSLIARWDDLGISLHDLLLCILWGGVLSGIANWLFIVASRHLVAAEVTLFMLLEFALGPLWVWLFVGETPTGWTLAGGVTVIAAVAIRAAFELKRGQPPLKRGRPSPV
ncbi:MAG: DMT family transporter [Alphaproteobacteria bacterium]|nr:DMT family transporter [Alphaproteobacteria bacterium]